MPINRTCCAPAVPGGVMTASPPCPRYASPKLDCMAVDAQQSDSLIDIPVLDDDLDFRNYMEDVLKDEGTFTVRTFAHPDDLIAAGEHQMPDIVLLDMKMGEFQGDRVLDQLQTRWPGLCVIVVTGYPSFEDMRATFNRNVFDYVTKPFSLAQLRPVLNHTIVTPLLR